MKTKIEIKHWLTGAVLFEFETEDNTLLKTIREADLYGANLRGADLYGADLRGADLYGADLGGANLRGANLRGADLYGADLGGANLGGANLYGANLRGANLGGANLYGANLRGADLYGAKNAELPMAQTLILPEGDIIGYKKCRDDIIVRLLIPKEARRSNSTGRKCRAEYAQVIEIYGKDKRTKPKEAVSQHDGKTVYRVGETVQCDKWDENRWEECSGGIHFYITRIEAENH